MPCILSARDIQTLAASGDGAKSIKTLLDDLVDNTVEQRSTVNGLIVNLKDVADRLDADSGVNDTAYATDLFTTYHVDYVADMDSLEAVPDATALDASTIVTLANAIKTAYEAHRADTTGDNSTEVHEAADSTNTVTTSDATDESEAYTLLNEIKVDFNAHLSQGGVHLNNDGDNTVSDADATDTATAVTLAVALKDALLAHVRGCTVLYKDAPDSV